MAKARRPNDARKKQASEDENNIPAEETDQRNHAEQVSALSDEVLDDIDRALKDACGFDENDSVSNAELERRASEVVTSYVQKGGQ
jgi:hypothetical protein